ncbi:lymphocyte antigen 75-like isoform X1 [Oreochromis niloticus]|uniref:Putative C-type lectin domain family 20 member A n=1 Tax=Oreochromis niloticus TaxID=8128 RepID=A0A669B3Z9_ORENI|nr:lymphocyte antigen 75-like isoform X1 [Oreochromis niloticus]
MRKLCIFIPLLLLLSPAYGYLLRFTLYTGSEMTTWENAQAFCREHHTGLVTIRNEQENGIFSGYGWIGLYRKSGSSIWKWSTGDELANYTNWDANEPQTDTDCAYKSSDKWRTNRCDVNHSFMCYDDLILVKENKTWEEALVHCRSLDGGNTEDPASSYWNYSYDLATLITPYDHTYAREKVQEATTDEVWTGLCNPAGEWLWVSGEQMQYKNIPSCPTNGFCGVLEKRGTTSFQIKDCKLRRNFFCYKRI